MGILHEPMYYYPLLSLHASTIGGLLRPALSVSEGTLSLRRHPRAELDFIHFPPLQTVPPPAHVTLQPEPVSTVFQA